MTCIVGIAQNGTVTIGGDSAGTAGWGRTIRADSKVFRNGPLIMGFTSSFRMGQVLRYHLKPPTPTGDLEAYMVRDFIPAVRECLSEAAWLKKTEERVEGGTFLIGVKGRLFVVHSDFQVGESVDGYAAVGSGSDVALGSLYATQGQAVRKRINTALEAAAYFNAAVAGPFTVIRSTTKERT